MTIFFFAKIGKSRVTAAKKEKIIWKHTGDWTSIIRKVEIRRSRKPVHFQESVLQWLINNTRPSNNTSNMIKWKDPDKQPKQHIVQWCEESLAKMFEKYKMKIHFGDVLKKSYFYNCVLPFIKVVKPMTALCPYHMQAKY